VGDEGGPTVSVCMPMARGAAAVETSVRSVLAQQLDDLEILIGDETGAVQPLVESLGEARISYHRNPHRLGFAANHTALLDRARGRYLAVLHDDDRWEPTYLSRLVAVLEAEPDLGLACCRPRLEAAGRPAEPWPVPIDAGRHDDLLETVLGEEWFLLVGAAVWRRSVWSGPARRWPDLCCADLQFFVSAFEAGWPLYFLDEPLMVWTRHRGQSGAWRGEDHGLTVAEDVLAFWDGWLAGRPARLAELSAPPRARWELRRARALLLAGRRSAARHALDTAEALGGADLDGLRRLRAAASVPPRLLGAAVSVKRMVTDRR